MTIYMITSLYNGEDPSLESLLVRDSKEKQGLPSWLLMKVNHGRLNYDYEKHKPERRCEA